MARKGRKENGKAEEGLVLASLADLPTEETKWLWPGRIARGSVTLLVGYPDVGKSYVALDIAARVSRGAAWPDGAASEGAGRVMLLSAEDHLLRKVRPALENGQADLSRFRTPFRAFKKIGKKLIYRPINFKRDLRKLERELKQQPDYKLVIVDPLNAFMGSGAGTRGVDGVRVLGTLHDLAVRFDMAVLLVAHLKPGSGEAIYRTIGSLELTTMARGVWMVARSEVGGQPSASSGQGRSEVRGQESDFGKLSPGETRGKRRLFLPVKNNLAEERTGLAFALKQYEGEKVPRVEWSRASVETSADEALRELRWKQVTNSPAVEEAMEFLRVALADGPRLMKEVEQEAKEACGISARSLERGRGALEVRAFRKKIPGPSWICLADWSEAEAPAECNRENLGGVGKNAGDFDDLEEKEAGGVGGVAKSTGNFEGFGATEAGGVGGVDQRSEVRGQKMN